jgi:hypothetical protein
MGIMAAALRSLSSLAEKKNPEGPTNGETKGPSASANRCDHVFHLTLLAPHLCGFALALNVVGVDAAGILDLDDSFLAVFILYEEIRHIATLVLLAVNPRNRDAVSFHPLGNVRILLQAAHHASFEVTLIPLEVPRTLRRVVVLSVYANRHIR